MREAALPARSAFAAAVGSTLRLSAGAGWTRQAELTGLNDAPPQPGWERFALTFRVAGPGVPPQGTYRLEHHALGVFDLFLVPVGHDARGARMEAVFNRLAHADPEGE